MAAPTPAGRLDPIIEPPRPEDEASIDTVWNATGTSSQLQGSATVRLVGRISSSREVAGVAEYYRTFPPEHAIARLGLLTGADENIGAELLRALARLAGDQGVRSLMLFVADNDAAAWNLLDRAGIPLRVHAATDGFYVELDLIGTAISPSLEAGRLEAGPTPELITGAPAERPPSLPSDVPAEQAFAIRPLGVIMEPRELHALEAEGVLNPGAARGREGDLYLFPRLVARGNYSRIGVARVRFDRKGEPSGVERLGIALEPAAPYERKSVSVGGCEDPRVTYVAAWNCYIMTYTAFSAVGPRVAMAASHNLLKWERLGLVEFEGDHPMDFNSTDNKDAFLFSQPIPDPRTKRLPLALIHRPLVRGHSRGLRHAGASRVKLANNASPEALEAVRTLERLNRESIWISYTADIPPSPGPLRLHSHHRLMSPHASWERVKVGGGTPPLLTGLGWLMIYHGVSGHAVPPQHPR